MKPIKRKWKIDFENETRQNIEIKYYELVSVNVDLLGACEETLTFLIAKGVEKVLQNTIKQAITKSKEIK